MHCFLYSSKTNRFNILEFRVKIEGSTLKTDCGVMFMSHFHSNGEFGLLGYATNPMNLFLGY